MYVFVLEMMREDGKVDVSLRPIGINRIIDIRRGIMDALEGSPEGTIPVGDKSSPDDISLYFRGLSKGDFRKAVGSLFKEKRLFPEDYRLRLVTEGEEEADVLGNSADAGGDTGGGKKRAPYAPK